MSGAGRIVGLGLIVAAALATTPTRPAVAAEIVASLPPISIPALGRGEARPIAGWTAFCRNYVGECAIDATEPAEITLTPQAWQTINAVNARVNRTIRPKGDGDHWGVADRWDLAEDGYGDCEDYQLLKRKLLAETGLPRRALRMTVVIDERGEGHAVLTARTDRGDFVLDNKRDAVLSWSETGYTFVKRESADTVAWISLGGATSPTMTANR